MGGPVELEHEEEGEIHHLPLIKFGYIVSFFLLSSSVTGL